MLAALNEAQERLPIHCSTLTRVSAFQKANIHRAIAQPSPDNALKVTGEGKKKSHLHCLFAEQVAKTGFSGDW